jgi:hypothetical protein
MRVIVGKASASGTHEKYPEGEIHAVLMFIKSDNHDKAKKVANFEMNARNWDKVNMSRIGTLNPDTFNSKDEPIKEAFDCAMERGFGAVIYGTAEKEL